MARAKRGAAAPGSRQPKNNLPSTDNQRPQRKRKSPAAPVIEREKRDLSAVGKKLSKMGEQAGAVREWIQRQRQKAFRRREREIARERKEKKARRQAEKDKSNDYDSDLSDEDMHRTVKQELFDDAAESSQQPAPTTLPASEPPFNFFDLDSVTTPKVHVKQEIVEAANECDEASTSHEPAEESYVQAEAHQTNGEQPTTEEPAVDHSAETLANAAVELQSPVSALAHTSCTSLFAAPTVTPVAEGEAAVNFFDTAVFQQATTQQENIDGTPLDRSEREPAVTPASAVRLVFKPRSILAGTPKPTSFTQTRWAFNIADSIPSVVETPKSTATPKRDAAHQDQAAPSASESETKGEQRRDSSQDFTEASAEWEPAATTTANPQASEVSSPVGASPRVEATKLEVARKQLVVLSERINGIEDLECELQRVLSDIEDEFTKATTSLLRDLSGRSGAKVDSMDIRRPAEKRLSAILTDVKTKLDEARRMAGSASITIAHFDDGLRDASSSLSEKDRRSLQNSLVGLAQENMRLETSLKLLEQRPVPKRKKDLFARLDRMCKRFDDCQHAVREARRKLNDKEDRLEEKRRTVKNLEEENARLKADADNKNRRLAQTEVDAEAQAVVNRNLTANLKKMSAEWDQRHQLLTAELLKANGEKATCENRSIELQRQLDNAQKTIEWHRDEATKLQGRLKEANHSLKATENLFAEKSTMCHALDQQVKELEGQQADFKSEADRERAAAQRLRDTMKKLEAALSAKHVRISELEQGATANAMQRAQSTSELKTRVEQLTANCEKAFADKDAAEELSTQRLSQLVQAQVASTQQKEQIAELQEQLKEARGASKETEDRIAGLTYQYTTLEQRLAAQRSNSDNRIMALRMDLEKEKRVAEVLAAQPQQLLEESQRTVALQRVMINNLQAQLDKPVEAAHADEKGHGPVSSKSASPEKEKIALNRRLLETQYLLKQEKVRANVAEEHAENLMKNIVELSRELSEKDNQISQLKRQPSGKIGKQKYKALESQIEDLQAKLDAAREEASKVPNLSEKISELESQLQRADADLNAARVEAFKVPALRAKVTELESQLKLAHDDVDARKALINRLTSVISRGIVRARMLKQHHKRELAKSRDLVSTLQSQLDAAVAKKVPADDVESLRKELEQSKEQLAKALAKADRSERANERLELIVEHYQSLWKEARDTPQSDSVHAPPSKKPRVELGTLEADK